MKRLVFLLIISFLLVFSVGRVSAAVSIGDQKEFEKKLGSDKINKETFDFQSLYGTAGSLNVAIMGCSDATIVEVDDDGKLLFNDNPDSECPEDLRRGAVDGMGNVLAAMYAYPPVSGMDYLASVGENMGIVPSAYAQTGAGFSSLSPILPLWEAFRNIAYVFFVILFVVIGIAIMFRVKISPQAVITIQSAIPKIVIALLLVTFSYAIAGFMVDLIYVFLILFIQLLGQNKLLIDDSAVVADAYVNGGLFTLASAMFSPLINGQLINDLGGIFAGSIVIRSAGALVGAMLGSIVGLPGILAGVVIGAFFSGQMASVVFLLVIGIFMLYSLIRIFFTLLVSYVTILILVIFGPILILFDALPFQTGLGTGAWFKNLLANIIVFPVTAVLLLIGTTMTTLFLRGQVMNWTPPLIPAASGQVVAFLIGVGMLLFTAQIINNIKAAFKTITVDRGIETATTMTGRGILAPGEWALKTQSQKWSGQPLFGMINQLGRTFRRWQ